MHASTASLILAFTTALAAATPTYVDQGVSNINARTVVDLGVTNADPNSEKVKPRTVIDLGVTNADPNSEKVKRSGRFEIIDLGVRDLTPEERFGTPAERRTADGISSCGKKWMPVGDADDGDGYNTAVDQFCYHVTHSFDNLPTVIGPGQKNAAVVKDGFKLMGGIPAQVAFEIHNKMKDGDHVPDEDNCKTYLKMMSNADSKCYGKKNQDTLGGTWVVGAETITYHGLPGPQTS